MTFLGHKAAIEFRHGGKKGHESLKDLDNDQGEVHVHVIPNAIKNGLRDRDPSVEGRSAASMSGGERSATLIHYVSAVAAVADPPFRAIDEFDVYQDESHRKTSMLGLIQDARTPDPSGRVRQHILLTPLDVSSAVSGTSEDIKVFYVPDPKETAEPL